MTIYADDRQGTLPDREIDVLLAAISAGQPWREALVGLALPTLSRKPHWFLDTHKADFYRSLRPTGRDLAVDIGPGSGVITAELATQYARVIGLEHHPLWSRFVALRLRQDGLAAGRAVRGDALRLPLRPASADLVVLNGVLEWVPEAAPAMVPRDAQLACLREIHGALKPGGLLGIAIENRWFFRNFMGFSPHGEPPFVAVLPRGLADRAMRRRVGVPYRTWIYGVAGYRRLLREGGFDEVEVRAALPTYHEPQAAVGLSSGRELQSYFSHRTGPAQVFGLLRASGFLGHVVHSFYISGRRRP